MDKFGLNFGQLIAYLIPGLVAIYALADFVPLFAFLIGGMGVPQAEALVPLLILGLATGIVINAFSWALLRPLFQFTGVRRPDELTYIKLRKDDIELYYTIIETNFRYHQFYSNMLIAIILWCPSWFEKPIGQHLVRNGTFVLVSGVLFFAARDSLNRAYVRMLALLTKEERPMTNGDPSHIKPEAKTLQNRLNKLESSEKAQEPKLQPQHQPEVVKKEEK